MTAEPNRSHRPRHKEAGMSKFQKLHAEHALYYDDEQDNYRCGCGWEPDYEALDYTADALIPAHKALDLQHAGHMELVLADNGIAIVELPKSNGRDDWEIDGTDLAVSLVKARSTTHSQPELHILFNSPVRPSRISKAYDPTVGPDLAAALLAAFAEVSK